MSEIRHKDLPAGFPPPDVPIDQTKGEIDYGSSGVGLGLVWLWRRMRSLLSTRHPQK